jgi:hypothetical protein
MLKVLKVHLSPILGNVFRKSIKVVVCNSMSCRLNTSLSYSCLICNRRDLHFAHNTFCTSNANSYPYICSFSQVTSKWLSLQHQALRLVAKKDGFSFAWMRIREAHDSIAQSQHSLAFS